MIAPGFRRQFETAQHDYRGRRYRGSLAQDVGLLAPRRSARLGWIALSAATALALALVLLHGGEKTSTPVTPVALKPSEVAPKIPDVTPDPAIQPAAEEAAEVATIRFVPPVSFSLSSITDWPSVSASIPALGPWPSLDATPQDTQVPTTQEQAS